MALILPGVGFAEARGSIGGTTYSRNKGGAYIRLRSKPTNPPSIYSQEVRDQEKVIAQSWKDLTTSQQLAWIAAAGSFSNSNVFGLPSELSGEQLYIKANLRSRLYNNLSIDDPPVSWFVPEQTFVSFVIDTSPGVGDPIIQISPGTPTTADFLYIAMTPPLTSTGIRNYRKYLRVMGLYDDITADPSDLDDAYQARFGDLDASTVGKLVWAEVAGYSAANGQITVPLSRSVVIT